MQLSLRTDRRLLRASARSTRHLTISLVAPHAASRAGRLPVSIAFVLDRSGSMDGAGKFALAREAVEQSLQLLRPDDRFTVVVYDDQVQTLVSATAATAEARQLAVRRLAETGPRGSTDLHAGWTGGARELTDQLSAQGVNRVLLLTDGLANRGIIEPAALVAFAGQLRERGIATTTFGVGEDFDERLLRDIAHDGGGRFYFIETPRQIPDLLTSELGEALEIVVREAALEITLPAGADATLLNRFRISNDRDDTGLRVELGDLVSGQELSAVLRIRFAEAQQNETATVRVAVASGDSLKTLATGSVTWTGADNLATDGQPRDRSADREVATLYAARARAAATEANRIGDLRGAGSVMQATARRIRRYADGDPVLEQLWRTLESEIEQFAMTAMSPMSLKSAMFVAESASNGRSADGKARRSPTASAPGRPPRP